MLACFEIEEFRLPRAGGPYYDSGQHIHSCGRIAACSAPGLMHGIQLPCPAYGVRVPGDKLGEVDVFVITGKVLRQYSLDRVTVSISRVGDEVKQQPELESRV